MWRTRTRRGPESPIPGSYWVEPGVLLAGAYPVRGDDLSGLDRLLAAGVTLFVDLTEASELEAYAHHVEPRAKHVRMPVHDMDVSSPEQMRRTLDLIERERRRGGVTYLHCWGGAGRTGTVVGCWLVRRGLDGHSALVRIRELRAGNPALRLESPQTLAQQDMVRRWSEALPG